MTFSLFFEQKFFTIPLHPLSEVFHILHNTSQMAPEAGLHDILLPQYQ
jgi:hypothetical protein